MPEYYIEPSQAASEAISHLHEINFDVNDGDGSMTVLGRKFLWDCVHKAAPVNVLDLGACNGNSAITMMSAMPGDGCVISVDKNYTPFNLWPWAPSGQKAEDYVNAGHFSGSYSRRLEETSISVALADNLPPIDFLLIDAEHRAPWPMVDFICLLPLLAPRCSVMYHDIYRRDNAELTTVNAGVASVLSWRHVEDYVLCGGSEWVGEDGWEAMCLRLDDLPFVKRDATPLLLGMMANHNGVTSLSSKEQEGFMQVLWKYYAGNKVARELIVRLDSYLTSLRK